MAFAQKGEARYTYQEVPYSQEIMQTYKQSESLRETAIFPNNDPDSSKKKKTNSKGVLKEDPIVDRNHTMETMPTQKTITKNEKGLGDSSYKGSVIYETPSIETNYIKPSTP